MSDSQVLGAVHYVEIATIISVFSGLATLAVVLRYWARNIQNMSLELSDLFIIAGLVRATLPTTH